MDIKCVACGEPWDSYGINNGDMLPWESALFKIGAGCPCCEGKPDVPFVPTSIFDVENGDDDPLHRIHAWENFQHGKAPKWERPADPVHWDCAHCGVQSVTDLETGELEYNLPPDAPGHQWYHSHPYHRGTPELEPAHTFAEGEAVCEFCIIHCGDCGTPLSDLNTEPYTDGYTFYIEGECPANGGTPYCEDCVGNAECTAQYEYVVSVGDPHTSAPEDWAGQFCRDLCDSSLPDENDVREWLHVRGWLNCTECDGDGWNYDIDLPKVEGRLAKVDCTHCKATGKATEL